MFQSCLLFLDHNIHRSDLLIKNIWDWGEIPPTPASTPDTGGKVGLIIIRSRELSLTPTYQLQHLGKNSPVPCKGSTSKSILLAKGWVNQPRSCLHWRTVPITHLSCGQRSGKRCLPTVPPCQQRLRQIGDLVLRSLEKRSWPHPSSATALRRMC